MFTSVPQFPPRTLDPRRIEKLARKFSRASHGEFNDTILAATALFLAEVVADADITLEKKEGLVADLAAATIKFLHARE